MGAEIQVKTYMQNAFNYKLITTKVTVCSIRVWCSRYEFFRKMPPIGVEIQDRTYTVLHVKCS